MNPPTTTPKQMNPPTTTTPSQMNSPTTASTPEPRLKWEPTEIDDPEKYRVCYTGCFGGMFPIGTRATMEQAKQLAEDYYQFLTR